MSTPEKDAEALRKAMKGLGTDEAAIIKIIANRNNAQRQKIKVAYKASFGRDLIEDLKSELKGNLEDAVVALFEAPVDYDVSELKRAMKGAGTDEDTLIEIIASRPNWLLKQIKETYKKKYGKDLESVYQENVEVTLKDFLSLYYNVKDLKMLILMIQTAKRKPKNFLMPEKENGELMNQSSTKFLL